jgi:DNA invertase Pin-like site-specific DNA recombinase
MKAKTACAYFRTSSATNVGQDKDSLKRQQEAVRSFCARNGLEIVREFYDEAVSGADSVDSRQGFCDMVSYMLSNGARTVLVENASRFARDLIVQETGYKMLKDKGIELIAVDSPDSFVANTPTAEFIRQVLGAVSQLEKAMLVSKLRGARDRKSAQLGRRIEGNPSLGTVPPAHVTAAKAAQEALAARGVVNPRTGKPRLRDVAGELAGQGVLSRAGVTYKAGTVRRMLARS